MKEEPMTCCLPVERLPFALFSNARDVLPTVLEQVSHPGGSSKLIDEILQLAVIGIDSIFQECFLFFIDAFGNSI
ncbi:MAG: hypothetical protein R2883_04510 [Caldisericia bacterium]